MRTPHCAMSTNRVLSDSCLRRVVRILESTVCLSPTSNAVDGNIPAMFSQATATTIIGLFWDELGFTGRRTENIVMPNPRLRFWVSGVLGIREIWRLQIDYEQSESN